LLHRLKMSMKKIKGCSIRVDGVWGPLHKHPAPCLRERITSLRVNGYDHHYCFPGLPLQHILVWLKNFSWDTMEREDAQDYFRFKVMHGYKLWSVFQKVDSTPRRRAIMVDASSQTITEALESEQSGTVVEAGQSLAEPPVAEIPHRDHDYTEADQQSLPIRRRSKNACGERGAAAAQSSGGNDEEVASRFLAQYKPRRKEVKPAAETVHDAKTLDRNHLGWNFQAIVGAINATAGFILGWLPNGKAETFVGTYVEPSSDNSVYEWASNRGRVAFAKVWYPLDGNINKIKERLCGDAVVQITFHGGDYTYYTESRAEAEMPILADQIRSLICETEPEIDLEKYLHIRENQATNRAIPRDPTSFLGRPYTLTEGTYLIVTSGEEAGIYRNGRYHKLPEVVSTDNVMHIIVSRDDWTLRASGGHENAPMEAEAIVEVVEDFVDGLERDGEAQVTPPRQEKRPFAENTTELNAKVAKTSSGDLGQFG